MLRNILPINHSLTKLGTDFGLIKVVHLIITSKDIKMKRILSWAASLTFLTILMVGLPNQKAQAQPGTSVSFQLFYDELAPYGQWIDDPEYGYVWAPDIDNDFRPYYSGGRWVMTEYGNTWVSDYDWGWAPFHYGRWTMDPYYGWVWIPGNEWGPAWVNWRHGGGYYGWAPLGPGININIMMGNGWYAPNDWWVFIPNQYIYSPNYYSYWRGPRYNTTIINNTTIVNNYYNNRYVSGPRRGDVERYTGRVNIYDVRNERGPRKASIRGNELAVYRPNIRAASNRGARETPRNAVRATRPIGDRRVNNRNAIERSNAQDRNVRQARPVDRIENASDNRRIDRADRINNRQERPQMQRGQQVERSREVIERQQNVDRQRMEQTQRAERQRQSEQMRMERQQQVERQRAERENVQRRQVDRQRAEQQNMQRQQMEKQRAEQQNMQRMQRERGRQEQMQRRQMEQRSAPAQREWRRPEPQRMQRQPQRVERSQPQRIERPQPQRMERSQPQRVERPQMQRAQPQMNRGGREGGSDRGRR